MFALFVDIGGLMRRPMTNLAVLLIISVLAVVQNLDTMIQQRRTANYAKNGFIKEWSGGAGTSWHL